MTYEIEDIAIGLYRYRPTVPESRRMVSERSIGNFETRVELRTLKSDNSR